jgi:hypothetical protein
MFAVSNRNFFHFGVKFKEIDPSALNLSGFFYFVPKTQLFLKIKKVDFGE